MSPKITSTKTDPPTKKTSEAVSTKNVSPGKTTSPPKVASVKTSPKINAPKTEEKIRTISAPTVRKSSVDIPTQRKASLDTPSPQKVIPSTSKTSPTKSSSVAPPKSAPQKSAPPKSTSPKIGSATSPSKKLAPVKITPEKNVPSAKNETPKSPKLSEKTGSPIKTDKPVSPTLKKPATSPAKTIPPKLSPKLSASKVSLTSKSLSADSSSNSTLTRKPGVESVLTRKPSVESVVTRKASAESVVTRKPSVETVVTRKPSIESVVTRKASAEAVLMRKPSVEAVLTRKPSVESVLRGKSTDLKKTPPKTSPTLGAKPASVKPSIGCKLVKSLNALPEKKVSLKDLISNTSGESTLKIESSFTESALDNEKQFEILAQGDSQEVDSGKREVESQETREENVKNEVTILANVGEESLLESSTQNKLGNEMFKSSEMIPTEHNCVSRNVQKELETEMFESAEMESQNIQNGNVSSVEGELPQRSNLTFHDSQSAQTNVEPMLQTNVEQMLQTNVEQMLQTNIEPMLQTNVENKDVEISDCLVSDVDNNCVEQCDEGADVLLSDVEVGSLEHHEETVADVQNVENPDVLLSDVQGSSLEYSDDVQDVENSDVSDVGVELLEYCEETLADVQKEANTDVSESDVQSGSFRNDGIIIPENGTFEHHELTLTNFPEVFQEVSDGGNETLKHHELTPTNFQDVLNARVLLRDAMKKSSKLYDLTEYDSIVNKNADYALSDLRDNLIKHDTENFSVPPSSEALGICFSQDTKQHLQVIKIGEENFENNYSQNSNFVKTQNNENLSTLACDPTSNFDVVNNSGSESLRYDADNVGFENSAKSSDDETQNSNCEETIVNFDSKQKPKSKKSKPKLQALSSLEAYNLLVQKYGEDDVFIEKSVESSETCEETSCKTMATFGMYKSLRTNEYFCTNKDDVARFKSQIKESYAKIYTENGPSYAEIAQKMPPKCFEMFKNGAAVTIDISNMLQNVQLSILQQSETSGNEVKMCEDVRELEQDKEENIENSENQVQATKHNIRKKREDDFKLVCRKKYSKDTLPHAYLKELPEMEKTSKIQNWNVERYASTRNIDFGQYSCGVEDDDYFYEDTHLKSSKYKIRKMRYTAASQEVRRYGNDYYSKMKNVIYMSPVWRSFY